MTLRDSRDDHTLIGEFGGGVRYSVSSRWGVRVDVREHVSRNTGDTLLDAKPLAAALTPLDVVTSSFGSLGIQFSNNPSTGRVSSLSGPAINGFRTFAGSGIESHLGIAAGLFLRF